MITILSFRELMETDIPDLLKRIPSAEYPPELLAARRSTILEAYSRLTPEQQQNVIEELAELEGSDTSMSAQLDGAGFGSGGVL